MNVTLQSTVSYLRACTEVQPMYAIWCSVADGVFIHTFQIECMEEPANDIAQLATMYVHV